MALILGGCGYNRLQQMQEDVFKAWTVLEAGLQERADLVPKLVEVLRGYAGHEKAAISRLINARRGAASVVLSVEELENREAMANLQKSQDAISAALSQLLAEMEANPALEDDSKWRSLKDKLRQTEDRIHAARQRYNREVDQFNAAILKFPDNLTNTFFLELEPKLHYEAHTQRHP